jgi:hypothetical protein
LIDHSSKNHHPPIISRESLDIFYIEIMADLLEDNDPSELAEHRFGHQEWDKIEENFINVGSKFPLAAI